MSYGILVLNTRNFNFSKESFRNTYPRVIQPKQSISEEFSMALRNGISKAYRELCKKVLRLIKSKVENSFKDRKVSYLRA